MLAVMELSCALAAAALPAPMPVVVTETYPPEVKGLVVSTERMLQGLVERGRPIPRYPALHFGAESASRRAATREMPACAQGYHWIQVQHAVAAGLCSAALCHRESDHGQAAGILDLP